jgi:hypothetical protein
MNITISERHVEFMKECWRHGISDSLISTIVPIGNSQVSKIRKSYKFQTNARTVSKQTIYELFEILKDKRFSYMISCSNPLRTKNNVEFWERHKDMFEYFMELRHKALNDDTLWEEINPDEVSLEEAFGLEEEATVEPEPAEEIAVEEETVAAAEPNKSEPSDFKEVIRDELKNICSACVFNGYYELARDVLNILEDNF